MNTDALESMVRGRIEPHEQLGWWAMRQQQLLWQAATSRTSDHPLAKNTRNGENRHHCKTRWTTYAGKRAEHKSHRSGYAWPPRKPCATGVYRQRCGPRPAGDNSRTRRRTDRGTDDRILKRAKRPSSVSFNEKKKAARYRRRSRKPLSGKDLRSFRS